MSSFVKGTMIYKRSFSYKQIRLTIPIHIVRIQTITSIIILGYFINHFQVDGKITLLHTVIIAKRCILYNFCIRKSCGKITCSLVKKHFISTIIENDDIRQSIIIEITSKNPLRSIWQRKGQKSLFCCTFVITTDTTTQILTVFWLNFQIQDFATTIFIDVQLGVQRHFRSSTQMRGNSPYTRRWSQE